MLAQRNHKNAVLTLSLIAWFSLVKGNVILAHDRNESLRIAITGSEAANIKDFPYTVALYLIKQAAQKPTPICTGSILHKNWVLTAAHCVNNPDDPRFFEVKAGYDKISEVDDKTTVQNRPVKVIEKHPKYWMNKVSKYDVALLKVDDFDFNDRVSKIQLYANNWADLPKGKNSEFSIDTCQAIGWGSVEIGVPTDSLRYANVTIRHGTKACTCFQMFMQRRLLCSDANELKGICPGDSGGPLVCNGSVAGVAHVIYHKDSCKFDYFGRLKLSCNSPKVVSVWMYVCPMLDFIHDHVPDTPVTPRSCQSPPELGISTLVAIFSLTTSTWPS